MGFFGALGKIMAGKPVYTPEDVAKQAGTDAPASQPQTVASSPAGPKSIPVVRLGRVECRVSGSRLDIYADIHNESNEALFLDRIFVLGTKRELDSQLRPGEAKQYAVYSGPLLANAPSGYAEVQYRKQSDGDYFADYHQIRSRPTGAHGYEVTEFRMQGPVKDI